MQATLPLQKMSLSDKVSLMEEIWNDLSSEKSGYSPPDWHGDILKIRKERIQAGEIGFTDWEKAKREIRDRVS